MTSFNRWARLALLAGGGLIFASATAALAAEHPAPENNAIRDSQAAKISLSDAIARSQKKFGGKAVKAELEDDEGPLAYEIELVTGQDIREIRVDAVSGIVLSNTPYESDDDEREGAVKGLAH